ncbi:MAG: YlxR family protein [Dehalococcoidia bacterium]|nr:YlxR family protein [Dehalococcoidia bacterium]
MPPTRTKPNAQVRARHVPQRTCVACRRTGDQRTFVRLVRTADGGVAVDERGRAPGRGAYLCRAVACWERGAKGALNAALRVTLNDTDRAAIAAYGAQFWSAPPEARDAGESGNA